MANESTWSESTQNLPLVVGFVSIIALMILPLPAFLLDLLLAVNIAIAVLILLTSIYMQRPLAFSGLPAVLLMSTLFRLGLNVASTRRILLGAAEGNADAGKIIETFGNFVVGGNTAVGIVVFLVLVLINFMVITKGAGRIAEVAARFTLDALPGKQMSVDAELAAGALTDVEARKKREEVQQEADFYGAMDGASKFVRGDAIAGLVITVINIVGGLLIATLQGGMGFGDAATAYTILTVGDGLVSQIPALFISTATGIVVTRQASTSDFSSQLGGQILGDPRVLFASAGVLLLLGVVPGMPMFVFGGLAAGLATMGWRSMNEDSDAADADEVDARPEEEASEEEQLTQLLGVQTLSLEIGYANVDLVDEGKGATLLNRLVQMRRQFAGSLGIIVPSIHIRDNLELGGGEYRLLLKGVSIGGGDMVAGRLLAIDPGFVAEPVPGIATKDPTFGLDALWIEEENRHRAEALGYTVVDRETVVTTHVTELLRQHASDLFGWQELEERLEQLKLTSEKLVDDVVGERITFGKLLSVCRRLLSEGVSIRDLRSILEAIAEGTSPEMGVFQTTDEVRARLQRQISDSHQGQGGVIHAALLDRRLEDRLRQCVVKQNGEPVLAADLATAQAMFSDIEQAFGSFAELDVEPLILAPPDLRGPLRAFLAQFFPNIDVISHREVVPTAQIVSVAQLGLNSDGRALGQPAA